MSTISASWRQVTPSAGPEGLAIGLENVYDSDGTPGFYWDNSKEGSPETNDSPSITPSPGSPVRQYGPQLLPRVRPQDQDPEGEPRFTINEASYHGISRSMSTDPIPGHATSVAHPNLFRRSMSPAVTGFKISDDYLFQEMRASSLPRATVAPRASTMLELPSLIHSRSVSSSTAPSRRASVASFDVATPNKVVYPSSIAAAAAAAAAASGTTKARSYASSLAQVVAHTALPVPQPAVLPPAPQQQPLAPELLFDNYAEMPDSTTLLDFLTSTNPTPSLIRKASPANHHNDLHFWWDVRNLRSWDDFSLDTINAIPGLSSLLNHEIPAPALPKLPKTNASPESLSALQDTYAGFYGTKVNAALKVALGNSFPAMTPRKPSGPSPRGPPAEFHARYPADYEQTSSSEPRARVVGLVRSFDTWNSGMRRSENPSRRVDFLRELACLQRHMRDHGCRYGYIVTEIELVCVRAGAGRAPVFGLLELAAPVQLSVAGQGKLTACLALWFLHMLAKNTPLDGQCSYRLDAGHPAALSRQNVLERDPLPFKPEGREKRDAKRNRGWVFPEEPLSKKESVKLRKRGGRV